VTGTARFFSATTRLSFRPEPGADLIAQAVVLADGISGYGIGTARFFSATTWLSFALLSPLVRLTSPMKSLEIAMIVSKDSASVGAGIRENFRIVNALANPTRLLDRPHVVPEAAQHVGNWLRKILIGVDPGQEWSVRPVVANVRIDFGGMLSVVIPRRVEVRGREPHDVFQDLLVRRTQPSGIHHAPNRDPRVANAGPSAAHAGRFLNAALVLGCVCGRCSHLPPRHSTKEMGH
jgi:hypothetical protein